MIVISVASTKGGAGKSMISTGIVDALSSESRKVALLDADLYQPHAFMWNKLRRAKQPDKPQLYAQRVSVDRLDAAITKSKAENQVVVVDTPGFSGPEAFKALLLSDIVVVPVNCSGQQDVWSMKQTIEEIGLAQKENPSLQATLLCNMVSKTIFSKAIRDAADASNVKTFVSQLERRVTYMEGFSQGLGPISYAPKSRTRQEFRGFIGELINTMVEYKKRRVA